MEKTKVTIINPPFIEKPTVGVTIPLGVLYLAGYLRGYGVDVEMIDAQGEGIFRRTSWFDGTFLIGLPIDEIAKRIDPKTDYITISTNFSPQQRVHLEIIKKIKEMFPDKPIIIGGNDATAHFDVYLKHGVNFAVLGEGENTLFELVTCLKENKDYTKLDGLAWLENNEVKSNKKTKFIQDLDTVPFPARDLINLENYWKRKFSHGPVTANYTPVTFSRGCPLSCSYCSSIVFWQRTWRHRSPKNFVDELEECYTKYGITEFEVMDDNFTLNMSLAVDVCKDIIARGLGSKIKWSTPNGVRPEKMNEENLKIFKEAGCKYLVFAPESGSQRLLKEVYNKFIDTNLILRNVEICHKIGIRTGCFIITGLYVETDEDYALTKNYVKQLAKAGLDEAVVFPMLPYPNTPLTKKYFADIDPVLLEQDSGANMNDLPSWYPDREKANKKISGLYKTFYFYKSLYHPISQLRMFKNILIHKQETKTERSALALISRFLGITPKATA